VAEKKKTGRKSKLDTKLKNQICKLLSECATVADACAVVGIDDSTYYKWTQRGRDEWERIATESDPDAAIADDERPFVEFFDATSRAIAKARTVAAKSLRSGMLPFKITDKIVEVFTETRIDKEGKPYEYKRKTEREVVRSMPGDWRAAAEFLKRRDPNNWSEKVQTELSGDVRLTWADIVKQAMEAPESDTDAANDDTSNPWA
jgi:hypothetical protein